MHRTTQPSHPASVTMRTTKFGRRNSYIAMTSLAMLAQASVAAPTLVGATSSVGKDAAHAPVALEGPMTTEPRDVPRFGVRLELTFDEPLLAYRRLEVTGGTLGEVDFTPGSSTIRAHITRTQDATALTLRVVDAVSATGRADAQVALLLYAADFNGDGRRDTRDLRLFAALQRAQDPTADLNNDGAFDALDADPVLGYLRDPVGAMPNQPPLVEIVGETVEQRMMPRFASPGGDSLPIPIRLRDDRTPADQLIVGAHSTNTSVVADTAIRIEGTGAERSLVFTGTPKSSGTAHIIVTVYDGTDRTDLPLVAGVEPNTAPEAIAHASAFIGAAPLVVDFDASESFDAQNNIAAYEWRFGDLDKDEGSRVSYTFKQGGTYEVTCTVTDADGLTDTATRVITVADAPYVPAGAVSESEARRFLWQAAWGPSDEDVAYVMKHGYEAWIDDQLTKTPNYITRELRDQADALGRIANAESLWDGTIIEGDDQLRQRIAWALSQIFAMRETGDEYETYSLFIKNALPDPALGSAGNFREMLSDITYDLNMGEWLTYRNNKKANPATGTLPDQNYAREIQQLFTIGLWELHTDGTRLTDIFGDDIPAYEQEDIEQFSRVFTGLRSAYPSRVMQMRESDHEFGATFLHDYAGALPAGGYLAPSAESEFEAYLNIEQALDNLFHHPTSAPFLAEQFIKRTTVSNPSPAYIARVARAYEGTGPFASGVRGDLFATFKAILLDDEARNPAYRANPFYGKVLEPVVIRAGVHRALGSLDDRTVPFPFRIQFGYQGTAYDQFGQAFMYSPSVFNFYRPEFAPLNTPIAEAGLTAPELQIHDDNTALESLREYDDICRTDQLSPDRYAQLVALSTNPEALVDWMIRVLHHDATDPAVRQIIVDTVASSTNSNPDTQADRRIRLAIALVTLNPGFRHLR
jgi:uncharacterized protein (DUF1800 family)